MALTSPATNKHYSSFAATPREDDTGLDQAWVDAANDVASALVAEEMRKALRVGSSLESFNAANVQLAYKTVRSWIHSAHLGWISASHPPGHAACLCRHEAIVIVGASVESKVTGVDYVDLANERIQIVAAHLKGKN
jgi:hypothetical protein